MAEQYILPVLPLRDTVVYPGVAVPISAGRPGTVEAVQEALDGDRRLFAVAQKENVDEATPEVLYSIGTVVRIHTKHIELGAEFSFLYKVKVEPRQFLTSQLEIQCSKHLCWISIGREAMSLMILLTRP